MTRLRVGSLCTGYGGLDQAVEAVFGTTTAWTSDIDPGAARIIAHRMPGVPNLGDLTTTDWADVEPVDIVTGGYPCQPFSTAGKRKGTSDERHIWPYFALPFAFFDPNSRFLRTSRTTFGLDLTRSCGTLPQSGSMRSGALYRRRRSALPTSGADSSSSPLLPTPRTSDTNGAGTHGDGGMDLRTTVTLLPTPTSSFPGTTANYRPDGTPYGTGYGLTLLNAARLLLPTPTRADGERTSSTFGRGNPTLTGAVSPPPSPAGNPSSDDVPPGQLTIDAA